MNPNVMFLVMLISFVNIHPCLYFRREAHSKQVVGVARSKIITFKAVMSAGDG